MPKPEELQFPDVLAVTNLTTVFLTAVLANMVRYIWYIEGYNSHAGAQLLTVGWSDDAGVSNTTCREIYYAAQHDIHWRPGYEDAVKLNAGPVYKIPAGAQLYLQTSAGTMAVNVVYSDRPL